MPNSCFPFSLTSGPRDSMWYVDSGNDCTARMTFSGKFTVVPTYSQKENPGFFTTIVVGPNKDLWFAETGKNGLGWIDPATMYGRSSTRDSYATPRQKKLTAWPCAGRRRLLLLSYLI